MCLFPLEILSLGGWPWKWSEVVVDEFKAIMETKIAVVPSFLYEKVWETFPEGQAVVGLCPMKPQQDNYALMDWEFRNLGLDIHESHIEVFSYVFPEHCRFLTHEFCM